MNVALFCNFRHQFWKYTPFSWDMFTCFFCLFVLWVELWTSYMVNTQSEHIVSSETSIHSFIRFETKSQQQVAQAVFKPGILLH